MRTLAIGDIHGAYTALIALLEAISLRPEDRLVTLGDYVDRGPGSKAVLDKLIELNASGQLIPLRGNHEAMMVSARTPGTDLSMWLGCGGKQTLESYGAENPTREDLDRVPEAHWHFLEEECRDYYEMDTHFFVHANAHYDIALDEQPTYMLHWERLFDVTLHSSGKVMVCGHTPQPNGKPWNLGPAVCIDTAAYKENGWLTCLEASTGKIWQANLRGDVRQDWLEEPD